jgi:hypothetical protein
MNANERRAVAPRELLGDSAAPLAAVRLGSVSIGMIFRNRTKESGYVPTGAFG